VEGKEKVEERIPQIEGRKKQEWTEKEASTPKTKGPSRTGSQPTKQKQQPPAPSKPKQAGGATGEKFLYIKNNSALIAMTKTLKASGRFVFDMEFISDNTFYPVLCLIQVATYSDSELYLALVDPLADLDLRPLWDLIEDPDVEKIVHDGKEEIKILRHHGVKSAKNVFDTQIAASFCGFGIQPGLATIADSILGVHIDKTYQRSVWNKRPLTNEQQRYAINDVKYLLPIREALAAILASSGMQEGIHEEWDDRWMDFVRKYDPPTLYQRVEGWKGLDCQKLAVLRELAIWREHQAQTGDYPRQWRYPDAALIKLARAKPDLVVVEQILTSLRHTQPDDPGFVCALMEHGIKTPVYPQKFNNAQPKGSNSDRKKLFTADFMWSMTETISYSRGIHPKMVIQKADFVRDVVPHLLDGSPEPDTPFFRGWRQKMISGPLVLFLQTGQIQICDLPRSNVKEEK
jgi:ribonuclease D